jgi:hypothetical protein
LRSGKPVRIPGMASGPEPDRCVVRGGIRDYAGRHPEPPDVALIIEVAKSSLDEDRAMAGLFDRAGIPTGSSTSTMARSRSIRTPVPPVMDRSKPWRLRMSRGSSSTAWKSGRSQLPTSFPDRNPAADRPMFAPFGRAGVSAPAGPSPRPSH